MQSPYAGTRATRRTQSKEKRGAPRPVVLSRRAQAKWLREAQTLQAGAFVQRSLERAALDRESQRCESLVELLNRPVVGQDAERRGQALASAAARSPDASAHLAVPRSDALSDVRAACHERLRGAIHRRARCFGAARRRGNGRPLAIDPLISSEMRLRLQTHLETKIQGSIWENEIRSRLARPLSASTFCSHDARLDHPLAALKLAPMVSPPHVSGSDRPVLKFPFSAEAHTWARRVGRCYRAFRFRVDVLAALRRLALAIRVLRRRAVPMIAAWLRRRRRAAVRIQRRFRRFAGWRARVLRPFVAQEVARWTAQGVRMSHARLVIAAGITRLFLARRRRRRAAEKRARHLRRWAAKTRVCLVVHQVWAVRWLRRQREDNVAHMWTEQQALEAIDRSVHSEHKTLLSTSFGKRLLKKELAAWRATTRTFRPLEKDGPSSHDTAGSEDEESGRSLRLRQCFAVFDLDQSGALDLDEFELLLAYLRGKPARRPGRRLSEAQRRAVPPRLSTVQVRNLFEDLDVDGNGRVTLEEMDKWWREASASAAAPSSASSSYLSGGLDRLLLQSHGLLFWLLGRRQQLESKFCARRFGLRRDLSEHLSANGAPCAAGEASAIVVDTFVRKRWIHEEEFRLLHEE